MGTSLCPALAGREAERTGFIEYHALGSRNASYTREMGGREAILARGGFTGSRAGRGASGGRCAGADRGELETRF